MNNTDIIMVSVAGTNGTTRAQRYYTGRFNGYGEPIGTDGNPVAGPGLKGLSATHTPQPTFPQDTMNFAQAKGDVQAIQNTLLDYGKALSEWQNTSDSGPDDLRIAKAVLEFLCAYDQFSQVDVADKFVLKLENLDVTATELHAGNTLYSVQGTAVFGK